MSCSRRTNSWLTNFVQLWRNTDRQPHHRLSQLALAITIAAKPIDWKNRWNLNQAPIRCASNPTPERALATRRVAPQRRAAITSLTTLSSRSIW